LPSYAEPDSGTGNLLLGCSAKGTCQKRAFFRSPDKARPGRFPLRHDAPESSLTGKDLPTRIHYHSRHQPGSPARDLKTGAPATSARLERPFAQGWTGARGVVASVQSGLRDAKVDVDSHEFYYRDTQRFSTLKSEAAFNLWVSKFEFSLINRRADAWGPTTGYHNVEEGLLGVSTNLSEQAYIGGGLGGASIAGSQLRLVGNLHSTVELDHTWITTSIFRDTVNTTAETIGYRIVQNSAGIDIRRNLFRGLADHLNYYYSTFSDGNHANQLEDTLGYSLNLGPLVDTIGYRFRFADFGRVTNHGYFTPQGLTSHEIMEAVVFKRERYYAAGEVALGHRSYTTDGYPSSDFTAAGNLSLGVFPTKNTFVEMRAEGGNYQVGLPSAWSYFMFGLNSSYVF